MSFDESQNFEIVLHSYCAYMHLLYHALRIAFFCWEIFNFDFMEDKVLM